MDRVPKRTAEEQETLARWDEAEHVLWATTTTPRVARRWQRAGYMPRVLSHYADGEPATWEVKLPWTGQKTPWLRVLGLGMSRWRPSVRPVRRPDDTAAPSCARRGSRAGVPLAAGQNGTVATPVAEG
jgi:hypothetical protein